MMLKEGNLLWTPSPAAVENANLTDYMRWLEKQGVPLTEYQQLWQWSVDHIGDFWATLFDYHTLIYEGEVQPALPNDVMPKAEWFPNVRINYAENIFAKRNDERPMIVYKQEDGDVIPISWQTIYDKANRTAQWLRDQGVEKGDRVVGYLPNRPDAIVALLAVTSIGAIWSSCPPDFGQRSVLDRFRQIEPKILIAVNQYQYGGKLYDKRDVVAEIQASLPSLKQTLLAGDYTQDDLNETTTAWDIALEHVTPPTEMLFERVPFNHPLWVLYSSGTTGLPKPIVHGHGGIVLEHVKAAVFHNDLKPTDRFFWYSSTGWMMWNYLVGCLLSGATIIVYDGSPAYPDINALFQLAEETEMTYLGISAAFISACIKAGIKPNTQFDLSRVRGVGSTGSPLTIDGFQWVYDNINADLALESLSGGTDLCTAFIGGARTQPIYAGELQGASLGAYVQAFDTDGNSITDEVGELVLTRPMPSMPIYFWNDEGMARYKSSYFEMYPTVWRHSDWIKINERGGCVIYGRSDSTINRQGIRMGTSEIYRLIESFDEIIDSLIIDLEFRGRESFMPLFLVLRADETLTDELRKRIKQKLRTEVSPRHVPNDIVQIDQVPYTLSGKKMEVPIRKILLGIDANKAANPGAMRNPESIQFFHDYAKSYAK